MLLTAATRQAAATLPGIELHPRGRRSFKNVAEQVEMYAAIRAGAQTDAGLPIDPVCRTAVDPYHGAGQLVHDGVVYHFCSFECANAFSGSPRRYAPPVTDVGINR